MKIVACKIDMIASFIEEEKPMPLRFRIKENGTLSTIKVNKVVSVEEIRRAGIIAYIYKCQSIMNGMEKQYELRYKVVECKWDLYKI